MSKTGKTGVTADTPKKIIFGAGTIHKNLAFTAVSYALTEDEVVVNGKQYYTQSGTGPDYVYTKVAIPATADIATYYEATGGWNFEESIVGATNGGSTLAITPEITKLELDGALVAAQGTTLKTGETATLEINFAELTKELIKAAVIGADGTSEDSTNYDLIESKADIATGDYWDNVAFVGKTLEGKNVIAILPNALCTSGLELAGENKAGAVATLMFEGHAELTSDLDKLPYKIYYPKATV